MSKSNKKHFKSFTATSEKMEAAMEALVKSEKFIVITQTTTEFEGKIGIMNGIDHDAGGYGGATFLLECWADEMRHQEAHDNQLKEILGDNGIENI